ncbi:hypothetical protein [Wenyingzhuangia sp. IMCC45574]
MNSLLTDLHKAEQILSEYSGGYYGKHTSAEEFHRDLVESIQKLSNGDTSVVYNLWLWFAPTCQWDDFVGDVVLGEKIFQQLDSLRNGSA